MYFDIYKQQQKTRRASVRSPFLLSSLRSPFIATLDARKNVMTTDFV